eukprot:NODE_706_length_4978_cov_0.203730.p2 type:complete len:261 gc:universal NODE_706_length_4978_cov_0.203730:1549-2331(+)
MPQSAKRVKNEPLPAITVVLQDETTLDLASVKNAVFFFYPKANTPGCIKQANDYKDHYADFTKAGFKVYGVSKDSCKVLTGWKSSSEFQFPLISDKTGDFAKHFGLSKGTTTTRGHVVVKDGKIIDVVVNVKPLESVSKAFAVISPTEAEEVVADEPARKEPAKKDAKKDATVKKDTEMKDAAKVVKPVTSPKKTGKEGAEPKTKEEIVHSPTHDKKQEELKGKVQKELKASEGDRKTEKAAKEQIKVLKEDVLAEIVKK